MEVRKVPIDKLVPAGYTPRKDLKPGDPEYEKLKRSMDEFGYVEPIIWNKQTGHVVGGHQRLKILQAQGEQAVDCVVVDMEENKEKALNIALNKISGEWDDEKLKILLEELTAINMQDITGFTEDELKDILNGNTIQAKQEAVKTLKEKFIIPPFSVLDGRQGYWQARKNAWMALGIESEKGRMDGLLYGSCTASDPGFYILKRQHEEKTGEKITTRDFLANFYPALIESTDRKICDTSIFDPVLCEIAYRWFCEPGGKILDPFAGGSVRGIVASLLSRNYTGVDLSIEQIEENKKQAERILTDPAENDTGLLRWIKGDSIKIKELAFDDYDFIFTCPPYADLEQYSDNPADLSNMDYPDFLKAYRAIIKDSVSMLKENRFAAIVIGDIRNAKGIYRDFISDTIAAFKDAGMDLYNEAIYLTPLGSLPIRVERQFIKGRKLGKTHQNMMVFIKGDPWEAGKLSKELFNDRREFINFHQKLLVFSKGDPIKATADAGDVEVNITATDLL
jgi:DNA modification methylase